MHGLLEEIFSTIELTGCVYFERHFCAPWAMEVRAGDMAQFHLIVEGSAIVEHAAGRWRLGAGDLALFPRGAAHTLADRPGRATIPGSEVVARLAVGQPVFAAGGAATRLVCGHYDYARPCLHPLVTDLPEGMVLSLGPDQPRHGERRVLDMLIEECGEHEPGGSSVVRRLSEVLLIQLLRRHYADHPHQTGFMAGVMDHRLTRAIWRIHRDYPRPLTVAELASGAGMSRSGFADRFREKTGLAPIEYLTRWRMTVACRKLRDPRISVAEVAAGCGYESDVAFMRAFRRALGMTPAQYRKQQVTESAA